jgi:bifunctional DNA-binding transcriptional regulator/antitoxin component of YhaV-PrlF toxin-antitoxin module
MQTARVTSSGQLSIPAAIRRRWATRLVVLEDEGDRLVVRPVPDDPIAAVRGVLAGRIGSSEQLRAQARDDDEAAQARR